MQGLLGAELAPALGEGQATAISVVAVLLLRLIWTAADVVAAGLFYLVPGQAIVCDTRFRPVH